MLKTNAKAATVKIITTGNRPEYHSNAKGGYIILLGCYYPRLN